MKYVAITTFGSRTGPDSLNLCLSPYGHPDPRWGRIGGTSLAPVATLVGDLSTRPPLFFFVPLSSWILHLQPSLDSYYHLIFISLAFLNSDLHFPHLSQVWKNQKPALSCLQACRGKWPTLVSMQFFEYVMGVPAHVRPHLHRPSRWDIYIYIYPGPDHDHHKQLAS
ncbi:hypothetical protein Dimus_036290 [Dionaea muscipula]